MLTFVASLNEQVSRPPIIILHLGAIYYIMPVLQTNEWQLKKYGVDLASISVREADRDWINSLSVQALCSNL